MWLGVHNVHDQHGRPTFFAGVVFFCEAVPSRIRSRIKRPIARARGFRMIVCSRQPDLVIAYRKKLFTPDGSEYHRAVDGESGFTPNRGTFVLLGTLSGRKTALLIEHRIEKAFNPAASRLNERLTLWHKHQAMTLKIIRRLERDGYEIIAGGDLNTWPGVAGYAHRNTLHEIGGGLDRIAVSKSLGHLADVEHLGSVGSDHKRLRATLTLKGMR